MSTPVRPFLQHFSGDGLHVEAEGVCLGLKHGQHVLRDGHAEIFERDAQATARGLRRVPRRYDQSTSGRKSSHRTLPWLAFSIEMTSRSPILWPTEMAFRR